MNKETKTGTDVKDVKPKKQAVSKSYLIKSFGENIKKLRETELITTEEAKELSKIHGNAVNQWVKSMSV